ncbi:hypothetical protein JCM3770_003881 [Rhodotorula araucariae]
MEVKIELAIDEMDDNVPHIVEDSDNATSAQQLPRTANKVVNHLGSPRLVVLSPDENLADGAARQAQNIKEALNAGAAITCMSITPRKQQRNAGPAAAKAMRRVDAEL